jgi:hypothetical protein
MEGKSKKLDSFWSATLTKLWEAFQEKLLLQGEANLQPQECKHA